jgi:hypothetical protein
MPTATLKYRLPEEEHEYRRAILGDLAIQTLWHIDQHCRGAIKHGDVSQETARLLQQIRGSCELLWRAISNDKSSR